MARRRPTAGMSENEAEMAGLAELVADDPERRPLRALVNSARVGLNAPVEELPLSEWRRLFDVNVFGHGAMTQTLPALVEGGGTRRSLKRRGIEKLL